MNAALDFAKKWKSKFDKLGRILSRLPEQIGKEALAFTMENYGKQQTPDGKPWSQRKDSTNTRALLVRTGRLRKSIRIVNTNSNSVRVGTDLNYAKYIQEGTPRMISRPFLGSSQILVRRLQRLIERKVNGVLNS